MIDIADNTRKLMVATELIPACLLTTEVPKLQVTYGLRIFSGVYFTPHHPVMEMNGYLIGYGVW